MKKIRRIFKRNLKVIIIFLVIILLETITLYWKGINDVLLKYNYYEMDGAEGIETFRIIVGSFFGFETARHSQYGALSHVCLRYFWY